MRGLRAPLPVCLALLMSAGSSRADLVINEIQFNSPGNPDVEYVELVNTGPATINLAGWYLLDDDDAHQPCALSGSVAPGQLWVVPGDSTLFSSLYPEVANANPTDCGSQQPETGFSLGNTGDQVRLFDPTDALIDAVAYTDSPPWPPEADGNGPSLELVNPMLDNALASSWSASSDPDGTPGETNSTFLADPPPLIGAVLRDIPLPTADDTVSVTAAVADEQPLTAMELWVDTGSGFFGLPMLDDGAHGDGGPNDGVFGASVPAQPSGTRVRYYVAATDQLPQTVLEPAGAPDVYLAYTVDHLPPPLSINEFVASNQNGVVDGLGDPEDWLEIRNRGPNVVALGGRFLTDDLNQTQRWELPDVVLFPGQHLLFWCDAEPEQGPFHTDFRLARSGGEIGLYDSVDLGQTLIHGLTYGPQNPDVGFGFLPDDADHPDYVSGPTAGETNASSNPYSPVCINEIFAASQVGAPDWIELHNRSASAVDVSGWNLTDDPAAPEKFAIPGATVIPAGGHLVFDANQLGFGLARDGSEVVQLTAADPGQGQDYLDYPEQLTDISYGRFPDGTGNWHFIAAWTQGGPNSCTAGPSVDPVGGLRFETRSALAWDATGDAEAYDVLRGRLNLLRLFGGDFTAADLECVENNSTDTRSWAGKVPGAGTGKFYLVRGVTLSCGFGSWDSDSDGQAAPRDPGIGASGPPCP